MLVKISNIDKIIQELPEDKAEALDQFNNVVFEKTILAPTKYTKGKVDEIDKLRSYLLYMEQFIGIREYEIGLRDDFLQLGFSDLEKVKDQLGIEIKRYVKPFFERNVISDIRASMVTALAPPDVYIEGIILDQPTKQQIRQYVDKLKETIEAADLSDSKKEALFRKLNDFLIELDSDQTRLEAWADLYVIFKREATEGVEWALENLERFEKVWTKLTKGKQTLPAPERGGELEAPRKQLPPPDGDGADEGDAA